MDNKRTDFRRTGNAKQALLFRILAIALVLYWLYDIVKAYFVGGPDAPSTTLLIVALVTMGGGSAFLAVLTWIAWKRDRAAAEMTEEEIAEMEALRDSEETEDESDGQ